MHYVPRVPALERPLATPRAAGAREALRVLVATREQAIQVRRVGLNQLRALLVTGPDPLRHRLDGLPTSSLPQRCAALRKRPTADDQEAATILALRLCATRVLAATREAQTLAAEIERLVRVLAPTLLDEPGVGAISAAFLLLGWSHHGRLHSEAAFARLSGTAPIPASSGKTNRYRLDRGGDHASIAPSTRSSSPVADNTHQTIAYIERRISEGKTSRKQSATSSATPPATSTGYSNKPPPLDKHRNIAAVVAIAR